MYIFIPKEVRENKMAPRSEMMVYLGMHPGGKGWIFMRIPNNTVFFAAQATFDELFFPRCPITIVWWNTWLQSNAPAPKPCTKDGSCECPLPPWNDEDEFTPERPKEAVPPPYTSPKGKGKAVEESENEEEQVRLPPPATQMPNPLPPGGPRRSTRETKVPVKPENIYGERKHPVEIEKGIRRTRDWKKVVEEWASHPGRVVDPVPSPSHPSQEEEVQSSLKPTLGKEEDNLVVRLCWEGGVGLQTFLLSKAVSPTMTMEKPLREWTYWDIWSLSKEDQEEWRQACKKELEELHRRDVYDMVERPKGRKVIKNRWVFDKKGDGRKRAHLVAKGFSQVEGLDYDQVFSPVVRFETVCLILAMAVLENWILTGLDVWKAYLYGELDEEIYMEQPEGLKVPGKEDKVLKLKCALYGLKQAGLAWWQALKQSMEKPGFKSLSSDPGLFLLEEKDSFVVAIIWVDDAIFCGPQKELVHNIKQKFMKIWETRDLGEVSGQCDLLKWQPSHREQTEPMPQQYSDLRV